MSNCKLLQIILKNAVKEYMKIEATKLPKIPLERCTGFLCLVDNSCKSPVRGTFQCYYIICAVTHILMCTGNSEDFAEILLKIIETDVNWSHCFDKRQVWIFLMIFMKKYFLI